MRTRRLVTISVMFLALGVVGVPVYLAHRAGHQQWLNQELIRAIKHEDANAALAALSAGADPNTRDLPRDTRSFRQRLLDLIRFRRQPAASTEEPLTALALTYLPSDTNAKPSAADFAFAETVSHALLKRGADPNASLLTDSTTLYAACEFGDERCVDDLVAYGANVRAVDFSGRNALMAATDNALITEFLLEKGANPNQVSKNGWTPLQCASTATVMRVLLRRGANPNAIGVSGNTPLFPDACPEPERVSVLLEYGANPYQRDKDGQNAFDCSKRACAQLSEAVLDNGQQLKNALRVQDILEAYRKAHPQQPANRN